jgi:hypothetical protein
VPIDENYVEVNCHLNYCLIKNGVTESPVAASSKNHKDKGVKRKRGGDKPSGNSNIAKFFISPPRKATK